MRKYVSLGAAMMVGAVIGKEKKYAVLTKSYSTTEKEHLAEIVKNTHLERPMAIPQTYENVRFDNRDRVETNWHEVRFDNRDRGEVRFDNRNREDYPKAMVSRDSVCSSSVSSDDSPSSSRQVMKRPIRKDSPDTPNV